MKEDLSLLSNEELVTRAQSGEAACIDVLLMRHKPLVYSLLSKYKLQYSEDREDFAQVGYIALWDAIKKYDDSRGAGFLTFAFICVQRSMHDAFRQLFSNANRGTITFTEWRNSQLGNDTEILDIIDRVTLPPDEEYMNKESHDELHAFLKAHLSDKQYKVLMLQSYDLSYEEIATVMHITVKQVDNTLQAVRKKLRSIW